jgi:hypothetical protein
MIQDIERIKLFSEFMSYEVSDSVAWTWKLYYNYQKTRACSVNFDVFD